MFEDMESLDKLHKDDLIKIIKKQDAKEKMLMDLIETFKNEMGDMRSKIDKLENSQNNHYEVGDIHQRITELENNKINELRMIQLERHVYDQQQYSRRECVEFVGISDNVGQEDLEKTVIDIFDKAGVKVTNRDFHAVHRLNNKSTVIAKLVNRKDAVAIFKERKLFRDLTQEAKNDLNIDKRLYVNESLCGAYRVLQGKCNALFKLHRIVGFYTSNGTIRIKTGGRKNEKGEWVGCDVSRVTHVSDLESKFGKTFMDTLVRKS